MRRIAALIAVAALAGCGAPDRASDAPATPAPAGDASADLSPLPSPSPSASPSARDYTPPALTSEAEKGEKGARNLLLAWASAMEDRAFEAAYALFGEYAERTGQSAAEYAATFAPYRTVTVAIGDGDAEGAAGSIYYEVPVTLTGTLADGSPYRREGTITVRRVNDVDGATPAQLRWHLERLEWKP